MNIDQPAGPTIRDWANAGLHLTKVDTGKPEEALYELKKCLVVNGVEHIQLVWLDQKQLRSISLDHGL